MARATNFRWGALEAHFFSPYKRLKQQDLTGEPVAHMHACVRNPYSNNMQVSNTPFTFPKLLELSTFRKKFNTPAAIQMDSLGLQNFKFSFRSLFPKSLKNFKLKLQLKRI